VTPGGDFVIDRHPGCPRVFVVSACSGHGFKHSAAIGEAVAAQIAGEVPLVDLAPFSFERLARASMPAPKGVP
jgi:sarcosine oxidase